MRTYRSPCLAGIRFGLVMLAGPLALGVSSVAAQDTAAARAAAAQDTTAMTLVIAVFPGKSAAKKAMHDMNKAQQVGHLEAYAVVSKDQNGKVSIIQAKRAKKSATPSSRRASQAVDGAVALLGRRSATGPDDTTGYAAGTQAGISQADVDKIRSMLTPGNSAIVFVVAEPQAGDMESAMQQAHAKQVVDAKLQPQP
jgi:uncharacterized membrane protein